MKRTITTAVAVLFATAISASAMTDGAITKGEIASLGYSSEAIQALTVDQVKRLSIALHNGEDSDIRSDVRGLMNKFAG